MITTQICNALRIALGFSEAGVPVSEVAIVVGAASVPVVVLFVLRAVFRELPSDLPLVRLEVLHIPIHSPLFR